MVLVTVIGSVRVNDCGRRLFDGVFDQVDQFEFLQRDAAVAETLAPQQFVDAEDLDRAELLTHPLLRVARPFLTAGHHQHGDAVAGRHMLCQRTAAAQLDVIGMRADRQHGLSRHRPLNSVCCASVEGSITLI